MEAGTIFVLVVEIAGRPEKFINCGLFVLDGVSIGLLVPMVMRWDTIALAKVFLCV